MAVPVEVLPALRREGRICELARRELLERCRTFEARFSMTSDAFVRRFDAGELGDDEGLFEWRALVEGAERWRSLGARLEEMLA